MKKRISIDVIGHDSELRELIYILKCIQKCGERGTHRTFKISVDGDGSGRLEFMYEKEEGGWEYFPTEDIDLDKAEKKICYIGE
jgi:hypothetical protein